MEEYRNVVSFSVVPALSSKKFDVRNVFIAKKFDTHKVCRKSSIFIVKLSTGMYETLFDTLINQSCVIHCCLLLIGMSFLFRMLCWSKLMLLMSLNSSECSADVSSCCWFVSSSGWKALSSGWQFSVLAVDELPLHEYMYLFLLVLLACPLYSMLLILEFCQVAVLLFAVVAISYGCLLLCDVGRRVFSHEICFRI